MSPAHEPLTTFERNARTVLEESVRRIDARTRLTWLTGPLSGKSLI